MNNYLYSQAVLHIMIEQEETNMQRFSFYKDNITDDEIINYLHNRENVVILSFTSNYTNIPHMCVVWGYFFKGKYYFQTDDHTRKVRSMEKGNDKMGISVVDPNQFPDYSPGSIPYISLGGTCRIRTKNDFEQFEEVITLLMTNYVLDVDLRNKYLHTIMNELPGRVLIEMNPEWVKVIKLPEDSVE